MHSGGIYGFPEVLNVIYDELTGALAKATSTCIFFLILNPAGRFRLTPVKQFTRPA